MATDLREGLPLEVRVEPSRQHSCPYDLLGMEKMVRALLLESGYPTGVFIVKPGAMIRGTGPKAIQGITVVNAHPHAVSITIQTGNNATRCNAYLIPPRGTSSEELLRDLRNTLIARKDKNQAASPSSPEIPPAVEEDSVDVQNEQLVEPVVEDEETRLLNEQIALLDGLTAIDEAIVGLQKELSIQTDFSVQEQACSREITDIGTKIRYLQDQIEALRESQRQVESKRQAILTQKREESVVMEEKRERLAALSGERVKVESRMAELEARSAELAQERRRQEAQTRLFACVQELSPAERIQMLEEMLIQAKAKQD